MHPIDRNKRPRLEEEVEVEVEGEVEGESESTQRPATQHHQIDSRPPQSATNVTTLFGTTHQSSGHSSTKSHQYHRHTHRTIQTRTMGANSAHATSNTWSELFDSFRNTNHLKGLHCR